MKPEEEEWYIGIEIGSKWTMASFYQNEMKEPETQSTVAGSQNYRMPAVIDGQQQLEEETLRKVMRLVLPRKGVTAVTRCVFSVEQVTGAISKALLSFAEGIGLRPEQVLIQDNKESFYAYAVSQEPELWMYEVVLFSGEKDEIVCRKLQHDKKTTPQISTVTEQYIGSLPVEDSSRDVEFQKMAESVLEGRIVSAVYLIGEAFEGGWMKEALQTICRGRRAFQGKNLYTKGACYAGVVDAHSEKRETIYFCPYKTKQNVFLKAADKEREFMYPLAEAGKNIYQIQKKTCILLEGEPVIDIWLQYPGKKEAVIESLELQGLIPEQERGCRLELQVTGELGAGLMIRVKDIGLGELLPGSRREWEYEIG